MKNFEESKFATPEEVAQMEVIDPKQERLEGKLKVRKEQYKKLLDDISKLYAGPYDGEKEYLESVKLTSIGRAREKQKIYAKMDKIREEIEQIAIEDFNRADLVEKMRMKNPAIDLINELLGEKEIVIDPATGKEFDPNQFEEEK